MTNESIKALLDREILPFVKKPGRYIGNEINTVHKTVDPKLIRTALAFPDVYEIGMSYTGLDILYHVLNRHDQIWAERVFALWPDMERLLRQKKVALYSLESFSPLHRFDIVGFTLQYELTFTNVLNMLDLARIPLHSSERNPSHPFVFAGGPCSSNPEPMAEFIDAFLIGDGEEAFVDMCTIVGKGKSEGFSRRQILHNLSQIRGVYVPAFYQPNYDANGFFTGMDTTDQQTPDRVRTRIVPELKPEYYPTAPIVPLIEVTHDRLAVEVMRGCSRGCRYCNAGMVYRPVRQRSPEEVTEYSRETLANTGYPEISFQSLSISDYDGLTTLMESSAAIYHEENINVSFPSMRLDSFNEDIAKFVSSLQRSGFTFAPEAGSERLRRVINKIISREDLLHSVDIALKNGWRLLKFYFMIGLPTETKEDVEAIADLIEMVAQRSRSYGNIRFNVSVSPFAPKPHSPFQWERQNSIEELSEKIKILKTRFRGNRRINLAWRDPLVAQLECSLGRADRRMAQVIYDAWKDGAVFDGWSDFFNWQRWTQVAERNGLSLESFTREMEEATPLPWDHIDKGLSKTFLLRERRNAYNECMTEDCKRSRCTACGIQRKGAFREYADCYRQKSLLQSHNEGFTGVRRALIQDKNTSVSSENGENGNQSEAIKYRLQYRKKGRVCYLSHLDVIRVFERAFRRAKLPLSYSKGFHHHPKIASSPPLSLGYSSDAEFLDIELTRSVHPNFIVNLNEHLPAGLKILASQPMFGKHDSLSSIIDGAEYHVNLVFIDMDYQSFRQALSHMLNSEEIEVQRRVKGKIKQINIRPYIESIQVNHNHMQIKTRMIENRTVRVREILHCLFNGSARPYVNIPVHRSKQIVRNNGQEKSPLEVLQ